MHRIVFAWFKKNGRDLPWRRTSDPYAIVLSEIMLQQTQVDRVIPKWRAFLVAFPTWNDLANAKTSDLLRLWQGLGYNRRAVMLHRLAKEIVGREGEFPRSIEEMKKLPGIGAYTANAVAAFAFRNPNAAPVDTNIIRILRRVFPRQSSTAQSIQKLAQAIAPSDVWMWNHALMDIGALHCSARNHAWGLCPLAPLHGSKPKKEPWLAKKPAGKFEESDRFFRGRIVDALRARSRTFSALRHLTVLTALTDQRFATLVESLKTDGVIVIKNGKVMLSGDE